MSVKWPMGSDELSIFKSVNDLNTYDQELKVSQRQFEIYFSIIQKKMKASIYCKTFVLKNENALKSTKSSKRNQG